MNLESPKVSIEKSATYLFDSLSDVKNFEKLMPESIAKFEVLGDDAFIFGLKGMPEIKLNYRLHLLLTLTVFLKTHRISNCFLKGNSIL